ncbi:hypothetical protein [Nannocystis pusilla]|uniref:hypothetical protein n=1 Tax=Nannocystis pusilla TaxID=889268 RepID=UPI003B7825F1
MQLVDLTYERPDLLEQAAELLHARMPEGWPDVAAAREEVDAALDPARIARAVVAGTPCSAGPRPTSGTRITCGDPPARGPGRPRALRRRPHAGA